jgi:archaellum biogenesis ATPase FlaH
MFEFLNDIALHEGDFNEKTEFLMDGFLAKNLITMIYADGGSGKSWMGMAIAKHCAQIGFDVVYLDFDNPLTVLKERGVLAGLVNHRRVQYVQRSKVQASAFDVLMMLEEKAVGKALQGKVVILDSLRNFADIGMDAKVMRVMDALMNLREAGATVIVLHHSNKDGKNYQGSNHIRNSVDNMYHLAKIDTVAGAVGCLLTVKKERASITDMAFSVMVNNFELQPIDLDAARMSEGESEFVQSVVAVLTEQPNINKTMLLEAIGREKDDKTARGLLDKFDGKHWVSERSGKAFCYRLQQTQPSN